MIPSPIQQRLQKNWGDHADAMHCNVECRVYDPASDWEWYIYAQDPNDPDVLLAIEKTIDLAAGEISLKEISSLYNRNGDFMELDIEFKPRRADIIWKQLKTRYGV